jgi:flagellar assembly factor FliW
MITYLKSFAKQINESKLFAGSVIILLNVGGKYLPITVNKSTEEILKMKLTKEVIVFAMAWMGTRDIVLAFILTCFFSLLNDYLFNYDSKLCCIPKKYRVSVSTETPVREEDVENAINTLQKYKMNKQVQKQHDTYLKYFNYSNI